MIFLDPLSLAKISKLRIRARYVVEGVLSGLHSSSSKGHSLEFAQHREYSYGDEFRHIDWKVFGRCDKFFVKQFQNETNLRAYLLLDSSGSMKYHSPGKLSKLTYSSYLAASIAYLLFRQKDSVGLGIFDKNIRSFTPPHNQLAHMSLIFEKLETIEPGGETGISNSLKEFGKHLKKRGLVVIFSDLFDKPSNILKSVKDLSSRHHEIIIIQVLDPAEIYFTFTGENIYVNMENGGEILADSDEIRKEYNSAAKKFIEEYKIGFRQSGIDYHLITTDTPLENAIAKIAASRR